MNHLAEIVGLIVGTLILISGIYVLKSKNILAIAGFDKKSKKLLTKKQINHICFMEGLLEILIGSYFLALVWYISNHQEKATTAIATALVFVIVCVVIFEVYVKDIRKIVKLHSEEYEYMMQLVAEDFVIDFQKENPAYNGCEFKSIYHFSTMKDEANESATLVQQGDKHTRSSLHALYEYEEKELPKVDDLSIVTDYEKNPVAIIQTTDVFVKPFNEIDESYARLDGNKSLETWKKLYKERFEQDVKQSKIEFNENSLIVCEIFKTIYTK